MKQQIHEQFSQFDVQIVNGKITPETKKPLIKFLNSPKIHARSISALAPDPATELSKIFISIGYDQKGSQKMKYDVTVKKIANISVATEELTKSSKKKGVICHSLVMHYGALFIMLLTAK